MDNRKFIFHTESNFPPPRLFHGKWWLSRGDNKLGIVLIANNTVYNKSRFLKLYYMISRSEVYFRIQWRLTMKSSIGKYGNCVLKVNKNNKPLNVASNCLLNMNILNKIVSRSLKAFNSESLPYYFKIYLYTLIFVNIF